MASGPAEAIELAKPLLGHISHTVIAAGPFESGSKLKYVANHAVAMHDAAAAASLAHADALGLDRQTVYRMLSNGAGQSRMSDLRMPLMTEHRYDPPIASLLMFRKDLPIIGADIATHDGLPTPLFDATRARYAEADARLPETRDAAAVFEVLRRDTG